MKTGLAEEIGFFVTTGDGTTVVLSLMRREESGPFPVVDFALLRKVEPLVAAVVRQYWAKLAHRFEGAAAGTRRGRRAAGLSQVTDASGMG